MMNFNKIIDSLNISDEMKSFFITGVENANGDILCFSILMEVMVEEEDYENAVLVRDTIYKIEKLIS